MLNNEKWIAILCVLGQIIVVFVIVECILNKYCANIAYKIIIFNLLKSMFYSTFIIVEFIMKRRFVYIYKYNRIDDKNNKRYYI